MYISGKVSNEVLSTLRAKVFETLLNEAYRSN
jgi:hypothetical protein